MSKGRYVQREEFATLRKEYDEHTEQSKKGFDRLADLEAELMGDERTGRPSLRADILDRFAVLEKSIKRRLSFIQAVAIGVLIAILVGVANNWISGGSHSATHQAPAGQGE